MLDHAYYQLVLFFHQRIFVCTMLALILTVIISSSMLYLAWARESIAYGFAAAFIACIAWALLGSVYRTHGVIKRIKRTLETNKPIPPKEKA